MGAIRSDAKAIDKALLTTHRQLWSLERGLRFGALPAALGEAEGLIALPLLKYYASWADRSPNSIDWSLREPLLRRCLDEFSAGLPSKEHYQLCWEGDVLSFADAPSPPLSLSELARRRRWGINYQGPDALPERIASISARQRTHRLVAELQAVDRILASARGQLSLGDDARAGLAFEHLVRDCLWPERSAQLAPLDDDLLRGWDLSIPEGRAIDSDRRALTLRVQLSLTVSRDRAEAKRQPPRWSRADTFLSPFELLEELPEREPFWEQGSTKAATEQGRVYFIRGLIEAALRSPTAAPLGPSALVPRALRRAIRERLLRCWQRSERSSRQRRTATSRSLR